MLDILLKLIGLGGAIFAIVWIIKDTYKFLSDLYSSDSRSIAVYEPFNVSEYLQRREKLILDLEEERRAKHTIVLWWGYDGLRLNKDGSWEWISRKPEPKKQSAPIFIPPSPPPYPFYPTLYYGGDMCQNTQATREQLCGLRMQLEMQNFNAAMQNQMQAALHSFVVQVPAYPSYIYAGSVQSQPANCYGSAGSRGSGGAGCRYGWR